MAAHVKQLKAEPTHEHSAAIAGGGVTGNLMKPIAQPPAPEPAVPLSHAQAPSLGAVNGMPSARRAALGTMSSARHYEAIPDVTLATAVPIEPTSSNAASQQLWLEVVSTNSAKQLRESIAKKSLTSCGKRNGVKTVPAPRAAVSHQAKIGLLEWAEEHLSHPYPQKPEKEALAARYDLEPKQVNDWFVNFRARHWKEQGSRQHAERFRMQSEYRQQLGVIAKLLRAFA